jgi:hypothetical protein
MFVELILLIVLVAIVGVAIRGGRKPELDVPLIVHEPGQYHITLAPQLQHAQGFLEHVAKHLLQLHITPGECPTQYFVVHEAEGEYLLAAALRGGMAYFQAISPQKLWRDGDSHLKAIREFSQVVMAQHPLLQAVSQDTQILLDVVESVAVHQQLRISLLQETS